ncbi:enoyl-CoA hydratase [Yinghuangia sp. YIM S09857]|uniref:enoyl-CoA hydratase n=1 Tax=Yinghuangia sp. YIM S09857 TaxID=3436929 RepID=UPI003F536F5B
MVLLVEVRDKVALMTLNRHEARNALSPDLAAAIPEAVAELDAREDVAAIVITGADPAFCAGFDLKRLATTGTSRAERNTSAEPPPYWGPFPPHTTPVIGAVNGPAVTGGFELALGCDFLIASERARFADTHARVGLMPGWGLTIRLPQLIGPARALQMSITGEFVDGQRACAWGLVNEVVPHDQLLPRALAVAAQIADIPSVYVAEVRDMYREMAELDGDAAYAREHTRARAWMDNRFDQARLAEVRQGIVDRGRTFVAASDDGAATDPQPQEA